MKRTDLRLRVRVWFEVISDEKDRPQTKSQTTAVSVYEVFGFEGTTVPYSLTIIDTPGYGHTEGVDKDEMVIKLLQDLFCIPEGGVDTIDAVGLVLNATVNRLDERTAYIFNSVTSLFGKDMEKNIVALMTHSDGRVPKDALKVLEEAGIKLSKNEINEPVHFRFNNSQKERIEEGAERAARYAFNMTEDGMKDFTDFLGNASPQSLKMTVKVMKERIRLEACIQNLKERVSVTEMKQEALEKNRKELSRFEEEMKKNQNYEVDIEETYTDKEEIKHWWDNKAVICNKCKENCHYPGCTWAGSPNWCEVMKDGKCTSCSGKCPVKDHVKEKQRYVTKTRTVRKTSEELKVKFEQNKLKSEEKTTQLESLEKEICDLENYKKQCLDESFQIVQELEKIALNVDSVSTFLHLEFLIKKIGKGDTEKFKKLERMSDRINKRNQAAAKYRRASEGVKGNEARKDP